MQNVYDNINTILEKVAENINIDLEHKDWSYVLPKKIKQTDHFYSIYLNAYQADLAYMPNEIRGNNGYEYLFVIVNMASGYVDAEPQHTRTANETASSLQKIINRKAETIVYDIKQLRTDSGGEFQGAFKLVCEENGIKLEYSSPRIKNQMAYAENAVGLVSRYLHYKMAYESVGQEERNKIWKRYVQVVVKAINTYKKKNFDLTSKMQYVFNQSVNLENYYNSIPVGTYVYPKFMQPYDIFKDRKIWNRNRYGTIRYDYRQPRKIEEVFIIPGRPIRYKLEGINDHTYTKEELVPKKRGDNFESIADKMYVEATNRNIRDGTPIDQNFFNKILPKNSEFRN